MANFEKDFEKKMNQLGYGLTYYNDKVIDPLEDESPETTNIYVGFHVLNGTIDDFGKETVEVEGINKTIKIPKNKLVTPEYILDKINKEKTFKNFSKDFKKLLNKAGFDGVSVYPTTYGIGIFIPFSNIEKTKKSVESILDKYNIEYKNEYSDARWVLRYKISKKRENIEKLKTI